MTTYLYRFRITNVVVKLFVVQVSEALTHALTPARVAAIAEQVASRIEARGQRPQGTYDAARDRQG